MTRRSIAKDAQPISPVYQSYNEGGGGRRAARDGVQEGDDEVLVDDVENGEVLEAPEVDSDPIHVAPSPYTPTQQEVDEHNVDHIPPAQLVSSLREWVWTRGRPSVRGST